MKQTSTVDEAIDSESDQKAIFKQIGDNSFKKRFMWNLNDLFFKDKTHCHNNVSQYMTYIHSNYFMHILILSHFSCNVIIQCQK